MRLAAPTGLVNAAAFQHALRRIRREHPALSLELHFGEAIAELREGSIDIALRGGGHALDEPDLVARRLAEWPWQICAAPGYLKTAPAITHPADLAAHPWVYHLPPHIELARGNERYLLNIDHGTVCNQLAAVRHLCEAGLGLALIIAGETRDAVAQGRLQILLPDWQLPAVTLYAVTPHRVQAARTAAVLRILQESFAGEAEAT